MPCVGDVRIKDYLQHGFASSSMLSRVGLLVVKWRREKAAL